MPTREARASKGFSEWVEKQSKVLRRRPAPGKSVLMEDSEPRYEPEPKKKPQGKQSKEV